MYLRLKKFGTATLKRLRAAAPAPAAGLGPWAAVLVTSFWPCMCLHWWLFFCGGPRFFWVLVGGSVVLVHRSRSSEFYIYKIFYFITFYKGISQENPGPLFVGW